MAKTSLLEFRRSISKAYEGLVRDLNRASEQRNTVLVANIFRSWGSEIPDLKTHMVHITPR